jgi:hypothetical protein
MYRFIIFTFGLYTKSIAYSHKVVDDNKNLCEGRKEISTYRQNLKPTKWYHSGMCTVKIQETIIY